MQSGSDKLSDARDAILGLASRKEVGKSIRQELEDLASSLDPVRERVAEIEGLYAIDFGSGVDGKIAEAAGLWQAAPCGVIAGANLLSIRRASPLLSTLYLKAIDIRRAYKFGKEERELASWFGTKFDTTSDLLRALRREKRSNKDETEWSAIAPMSKSLKVPLQYLLERKVIKGRRILARSRAGKWMPFELKWLRDDPDAEVLVVYEKVNSGLFHFLKGEWLNSYVHDIIDDQLIRHDVPYELYTQVSYQAPPDVIRAASDFDVIGRFRDTVVCVECKSGRLYPERGDYEDLMQRTECVRTVLGSMGTGETHFLFFVVYDPTVNLEEEIRGQLEPHDIRPLRPTEVRSVMSRVLEASLA